MEKIKKQIWNNYSIRNEKIKYIVIHDTGNTSKGANAQSHFIYFDNGNRGSSADIFVDDVSAWYVNDYIHYYTWHCGDGKGAYGITNSNSVGVEMCINADGNYEKTVENTVRIVKELMQELDIPLSHVVRHYDASRKNCPQSMNKGDWQMWDNFKKKIAESEELTVTQYEELKAEIAKLKSPMVYNYIDDNMPDWAKPTIEKLVSKGILQGSGNGLNLTEDFMRMLVINDRAGLYD